MRCFSIVATLLVIGCSGPSEPVFTQTDTSPDVKAEITAEDAIEEVMLDAMTELDIADVLAEVTSPDVVLECQNSEDCRDLPVGPCEMPICDKNAGVCVKWVFSDGTPCGTPDACVLQKTCQKGECTGASIVCDDNNPCTEDKCDPAVGCVFKPVPNTCDDGNPCTKKDVCDNGKCVGQENTCKCSSKADCDAMNDEDKCNGTLICEGGFCIVDVGTVILCEQPTNNPCIKSVCNPKTGLCEEKAVNNGAPCDDNDACTTMDMCAWGKCMGGPPVNCDDLNPCTADSCDSQNGCLHTPSSGSCDDGDACTTDDRCVDGKCIGGSQLKCDDENVCTTDSCDSLKGCLHQENTGPCDDKDLCTVGDKCVAGKCESGEKLDCDDGNPCTDDSCDPKSGCVHANNTVPCDDGNVCTTKDTCKDGVCVGGSLVDCDDKEQCTRDTCDPLKGCQYTPLTGSWCTDGDECTENDTCTSDGKCQPGPQKNCDDGNVCTIDKCEKTIGCVTKKLEDGTPCDDGNPCTLNDKCTDGVCEGEGVKCPPLSKGCMIGSCSPQTQSCGYLPAPDTTPCNADDNACTVGDHCDGQGNCIPGKPTNCDDGNPCTEEKCDPNTGGCITINVPLGQGTCTDNNACTEDDKCDGNGGCVGKPKICQPKMCYNVQCNPVNGKCEETYNNGAACDDGDPCYTNKTCLNGVCQGGTLVTCPGANQCVDAVCVAGVGCKTYPRVGETCNDSNACTYGEKCDASGDCKGGTSYSCAQPNPLCDGGGGCYCSYIFLINKKIKVTCNPEASSNCDAKNYPALPCRCGSNPECSGKTPYCCKGLSGYYCSSVSLCY